MPRYIPYTEDAADRLFPRTMQEKVLGSDEEDRSPKSWIPTLELTIALSILEEYAQGAQATLRRLEEKEWDAKGIPENKREYRDWSGPKKYAGAHVKFLKHFVSHDGHSLKFAVRQDQLRQEAAAMAKQSSQDGAPPTEGNARQ